MASGAVWEYGAEIEQDERWLHDSYWLAQYLGTAHSARYCGEARPGVQIWSVSAGEGNAHGARRFVWRVRETGRLYCECCAGARSAHSGAVLVWDRVHGRASETSEAA